MPLEQSGKAGQRFNREPGDLPATERNTGALGWRARRDMMTTKTLGTAASAQSRLMQLALSALLGIFVIGFVGFSHVEAAHNAGHDYRHSMAFPCH